MAKETRFLKKYVVDYAKNLIKSLRNGKENNFVYEERLYKISKDDSVRVVRYYPKSGGACYQNMGGKTQAHSHGREVRGTRHRNRIA